MPYDPAQPANNSALSSQVMRNQFTGIKDLIDAMVSITAAQVDGVTTLNPGEDATVTVSITGTTLHLTFGIPQGDEGLVGPPGEVTLTDLTNAINGTSSNSNTISMLGMTVSDPPTQAEMQTIANKLDELINTLRR